MGTAKTGNLTQVAVLSERWNGAGVCREAFGCPALAKKLIGDVQCKTSWTRHISRSAV